MDRTKAKQVLLLLAFVALALLITGKPSQRVALAQARAAVTSPPACLCGLKVPLFPDPSHPVGEAPGPDAGAAAQNVAEADDDVVSVQLAVFGLAVAAAVLGLLGYLLRRGLGLVNLPPPEDEPPHH